MVPDHKKAAVAQICMIISCQCGQKSLKDVSDTLLNLLNMRIKGEVQPDSRKVYLRVYSPYTLSVVFFCGSPPSRMCLGNQGEVPMRNPDQIPKSPWLTSFHEEHHSAA
ncbi:hypothetical protein XENOCAPTIV_009426 [Xenoophorus captivus]|uniref:Uncharacterized protein n=1 Tax=Xenoophorus captivus TaxID=1517983 RepID=A0ABV0S1Q6_9TELE